jgi:rhodanese-related sulfurtransferase
MLKEITREQIVDQLDSLVLVEALPQAHYDQEHLPGAVRLDGRPTVDEAREVLPDLSARIVVYCSGIGCTRSEVTARSLLALGYSDIAIYRGGKTDWFDAGLVLESART